jgi:hypothetical protein
MGEAAWSEHSDLRTLRNWYMLGVDFILRFNVYRCTYGLGEDAQNSKLEARSSRHLLAHAKLTNQVAHHACMRGTVFKNIWRLISTFLRHIEIHCT